MRDRDNPCHFCGEMTNSLAGNPGLWPLLLCIEGCNGEPKTFHTQCVVDRLSQLAAEKEARAALQSSNDEWAADCKSISEACGIQFDGDGNLEEILEYIGSLRTAKEAAEARVKELEALKQIAEGILDRIEPSTLGRGFDSVSIRTLCGDVKSYYRRQEPMK